MAVTQPYLEDANGNKFYFPQKFYIRSESLSRRHNPVAVPFVDQSVDTSDHCYNPRRVDVSGFWYMEDDAEAIDFLTQLKSWANKRNLKLVDKGFHLNIDKVLEISIEDNVRTGYGFQVSFGFVASDPFWYGDEQTVELTSFPVELDIGGNATTYPTFSFELTAGGSLIILTINSVTCQIIRQFSAGDVIVVNSKKGTVTINEQNGIAYFSGIFPNFNGGQKNTINYQGPSASIIVKYEEAYI